MTTSVALCTYNGEKYIKEQIDSLLNQSVSVDEIIIVDDVSTDRTMDIIKEYQSKIIKIYQNNENIGFVKNFQKAISLANGEIIFLCDQDDIWSNKKVERITDVFRRLEQVQFVFSDASVIDEKGNIITESLFGTDKYKSIKLANNRSSIEVFNNINIKGCLSAIRQQLKNLVFPVGALWGHDHWLAMNAFLIEGLYYVDERLIQYRRHSGHYGVDATFLTNNRNDESLISILERRNKKLLELTNSIRELELNINEQKKIQLHQYIEALSLRINMLRYASFQSLLELVRRKYYNLYFKGYKTFLKDIFRYVKTKINFIH